MNKIQRPSVISTPHGRLFGKNSRRPKGLENANRQRFRQKCVRPKWVSPKDCDFTSQHPRCLPTISHESALQCPPKLPEWRKIKGLKTDHEFIPIYPASFFNKTFLSSSKWDLHLWHIIPQRHVLDIILHVLNLANGFLPRDWPKCATRLAARSKFRLSSLRFTGTAEHYLPGFCTQAQIWVCRLKAVRPAITQMLSNELIIFEVTSDSMEVSRLEPLGGKGTTTEPP